MRGLNHKALEARNRKKEIQQEKLAQEEKLKQDLLWKDNYTESKLQKKEEQVLKHLEKLKIKQELKRLSEEESKNCKPKNFAEPTKKTTRAEIQARALKALEESKKQQNAKIADMNDICTLNLNHMLAEEALQAKAAGQMYISAGSVDEFLSTVDKVKKVGDFKQMYSDYEKEHLPRLREEFPALKRSQLKEKLWKQWQKAPENPINRVELFSTTI